MATNKFASMLERNTNRITVILVYTVLEWTLIILLLLNALFSYLIAKFAGYFGLKQPCSWCSRIDQILSPSNGPNSYRSSMCEAHAAEISRLGYCSNHGRLAESEEMCTDCVASRPGHDRERVATGTRIGFISWVSTERLENGEKGIKCSCCGESLTRDLYPPYWILDPSWGATLKFTQKGGLVSRGIDTESNGSELKELCRPDSFAAYHEDGTEIQRNDEQNHPNDGAEEDGSPMLNDGGSSSTSDACEETCSMIRLNLHHELNSKEADEILGIGNVDADLLHQSCEVSVAASCPDEDDSLEFIISGGEMASQLIRTIPLELIDSLTVANHYSCNTETASLERLDNGNEDSGPEELEAQAPAQEGAILQVSGNQEKTNPEEVEQTVGRNEELELEVVDVEEMMEDLVEEVCKQVITLKQSQTSSSNTSNFVGQEWTGSDFPSDQTESARCEPRAQEPSQQQNPSSTIVNGAGFPQPHTSITLEELGAKQEEETTTSSESILVDKNEAEKKQHVLLHLDPNEADEEKLPETPTSFDSMHNLHKKLLLDKRETGMEESIDGSVVSENEVGDPVLTIERLKTALKAERKALSALYSELEEERSASAIAANQTMAMINRLQEEKAAVQMEALQYQRMMEEQSQYDQEALQLLNELVVKREKEKQELETELEAYRKKVSDYETKEKIRIIENIRSRTSSATCSNADDIDDMAIDLNHEAKGEDGRIHGKEENTDNAIGDEVINLKEIALDCVKQMTVLDDSLAEFEEERQSILDQLKTLEEKLLNLKSNDHVEEVNSTEHSSQYIINKLDQSYELNTPTEDGISSDIKEEKNYPQKKTLGSMAKSLLPLLDAADGDAEKFMFQEISASEAFGGEHSPLSQFELDSDMITIEEVVDHVYERLQALEANREFMKHCMSSMQKGDRGMELLQEILQHLRDLKAVELHTKDMIDDPLEHFYTG